LGHGVYTHYTRGMLNKMTERIWDERFAVFNKCQTQNLYTETHVNEPWKTGSSAVAKRPCYCCVGQLWPNVTGRRFFADIIGVSSSRSITSCDAIGLQSYRIRRNDAK